MRLAALGWGAAAFIVLVGCQQAPAAPAARSASPPAAAASPVAPAAAGSTVPSAAPDLPHLRVAHAAISPAVAPLWIASDLGLDREQGLDIEVYTTKTAPISQAALASGEVDFAWTGLPTTMAARAGGSDVVFLGATQNRAVANLVTQPAIAAPEALRGKTLGVQSIGGTVHIRTLLALDRLGLDPTRDAITIIQSGDDPTSAAALTSGAIDGTALSYAVSAPLKAQGYPGWDLLAMNVSEINGMVTRRVVTQDRPEETRRLLRAIAASMAYLRRIDTDAEARARVTQSVTTRMQTAPEGVLLELDAVREHWPVDLQVNLDDARQLHAILQTWQPAVSQVTLDDVLVLGFREQLQQEGFFNRLGAR